jgi:hypothetical protein
MPELDAPQRFPEAVVGHASAGPDGQCRPQRAQRHVWLLQQNMVSLSGGRSIDPSA